MEHGLITPTQAESAGPDHHPFYLLNVFSIKIFLFAEEKFSQRDLLSQILKDLVVFSHKFSKFSKGSHKFSKVLFF